jgi:hypothetical protein
MLMWHVNGIKIAFHIHLSFSSLQYYILYQEIHGTQRFITVYKSPALVTTLSQLKSVHTLTPHFSRIHGRIVLSSMPACSN